METEKNLTPLMKQYWDIKSLHQDKIVLFRMGDFYEMFYDDAVKAAPILGITLTSRNKKSQDDTPMCGVPHHSIAGPINKLLASGLKVAICEQIEDPRQAKGIVKRAVTRILTPGMVYDYDALDGSKSHYIACYQDSILALLDVTTGESIYFEDLKLEACLRVLSILPIAELVLVDSKIKELSELSNATEILLNSLQEHVSVSRFWSENLSNLQSIKLPLACEILLAYITSASQLPPKTIKPFEKRTIQQKLAIPAATFQHLEIFLNNRGETAGTFFQAIDRTKTSVGARYLRSQMSFPLANKEEILQRQIGLKKWINNLNACKSIREFLSQAGDVERRLGKISQSNCSARDILSFAESLSIYVASIEYSKNHGFELQQELNLAVLERLGSKIKKSISSEAPLSTKQGSMFLKGVSGQLDELIELSSNSAALLENLEKRERDKTGISSLKVRYNNVFGYYIEVTHTHKDKVPPHYMRKQTLSTAERFCTDELIELEKKVLSAQARRFDLEFTMFEELKAEVLTYAQVVLQLSQEIARLDFETSGAWLAVERKYICPMFSSHVLKITHSRHPVVEQFVKDFVPNNIELQDGGCMLLTGPNMAGKSTLMRQVALTVILAQMGYFVPASAAELPLYESLFTRIGASDQLAEGLSTFMVEMQETATMLKSANQKSLLILDEVGRGTSTFDGMSLAQAILEYIVSELKSQTFFATHYHELSQLENEVSQIKNAHMSVADKKGQIHFLYTLTAGAAQKSYGIQVAQLAGLPKTVTSRAQGLLKTLENKNVDSKQMLSQQLGLIAFSEAEIAQSPLESEILQDMKNVEVLNMTPMQAIQKIHDWKSKLI